MNPRDRLVEALIRGVSMASFLGRSACVAAECGNEELAYHAARMSWKWATWAAEDAERLSAWLEVAR